MKNWPIGELLPVNKFIFISFIKKILTLIDQDDLIETQQPKILVHSKYNLKLFKFIRE